MPNPRALNPNVSTLRKGKSKRKGKKAPKQPQGLIGSVFMPEAGSTPEVS